MEIPDNWLDVICKECDMKYECDEHALMCKCAYILYDMMLCYANYQSIGKGD